MIDVMVVGAAGKMGSLLTRTVAAQSDMRVVGVVDVSYGTETAPPSFASLDAALAAVRPGVAVDFTVPSAVFANASRLLATGIDTIVGTTGLSDERMAELAAIAAERNVRLLIVPNFALGAILMMRFAAEAARFLPRAEIVEMHEERKIDAPSGTSLRTARLIGEAGAEARATDDESHPSRGLGVGPVRIHSIRLPGAVAHQEVVFGDEGEVLTVRHDTISRESFMGGVLLAIRRIADLEGTVVGLENLIT